MTQMISHEIKICVICVTDTLCHISKDGSVHDLERVVKGLFIDSCYFNNNNLKAFEKQKLIIFMLLVHIVPCEEDILTLGNEYEYFYINFVPHS